MKILSLSQKIYIDKVLDWYDMKNCSSGDTPVTKGDKLSLLQYLKNNYQKEQMKDISHSSAVESLMFAQVCTRPDIAYVIEKLGGYLCNPEIDH